MRILFLPLDSRPVNYRLPCQMLESTGHTCIMPPPECMDFFDQPADFDRTMDFLREHYASCDALVLSVDHLCYGSLMESRTAHTDTETVLHRLSLLEAMVRENPKPVHAWNVILRNTISVLSSDDLTAYHALSAYSTLQSIYEETHSLMDRAKAESARQQIPPGVLEKYLATRARNHAVNQACIELARKGVFSSLLLLVEDSNTYGFQVRESRKLLDAGKGLSHVFLHNGTDEGGFLSIMRALELPVQDVSLVFFPEESTSFTALYADRPFVQNLDSVLRYSGIRRGKSENVLAILLPPGGVQRDSTETALQSWDIAGISSPLNELINDPHRHVYLLDLLSANGGCVALMNRLEHPERLSGYSAWNTASNSMGSLVAQIRADMITARQDLCALRERLLDDLFYQGLVRQRFNDMLTGAGEDPMHLHHPEEALLKLRALADACLSELSPALRNLLGTFDISLPWNRVFEADLSVSGGCHV